MGVPRRIKVSKIGDVTIVRFVDRKILDEVTIQEVAQELFAIIDEEKCRRLLLNFTGVDFLSSAALGKLIQLDKKMKAVSGKLKLSNIKPEIYEVFAITKLNKVFDIRNEEQEAWDAF